MGILRALLGQMEPSDASGFDPNDEPGDLNTFESRYASAQAAIDHAVRLRISGASGPERRDPLRVERRISDPATSGYAGPERRGASGDRRSRSQSFGRRLRDTP